MKLVSVVALVLSLLLLSSIAEAQWDHSILVNEMRPNGSVYFRVDPEGTACLRVASAKVTIMFRRVKSMHNTHEADSSVPEWAYWSGTGAFDLTLGDNVVNAPRSRIEYTSPHQFDTDSTAYYIPNGSEWIREDTEMAYRFDCNGLKSDWFYTTCDRIFVTPRVPDTTLLAVQITDGLAFGLGCEANMFVASGDTVAVRFELWDSVGSGWVGAEDLLGNAYSSWLPVASAWPLSVLLPTTMTTDGVTRYYIKTLDNVEHGPYVGPVIASSGCSDITMSGGGGLVEGDPVVLTGINFGIKSPVGPVIFDDFEDGVDGVYWITDGSSGGDHAPLPTKKWDEWHGYPDPDEAPWVFMYTDSLSVDGRGMCLQVHHMQPASLLYLDKFYDPTGFHYFNGEMKMRFLTSDPDLMQSGNVKMMRFVKDGHGPSGAQNTVYYRTLCSAFGNEYGQMGFDPYGNDAANIPTNMPSDADDYDGGSAHWLEWSTMEWIKNEGSDANEADGFSKITRNTEVIHETNQWAETVLAINPDGGNWWDWIEVGGQAPTGISYPDCTPQAPDDGCYTFWDHIYFDNTWQRVEFGNADTYSACTVRQIQYPLEWSDTTITVMARLQGFSSGQTIYAFVVNDDNQPTMVGSFQVE